MLLRRHLDTHREMYAGRKGMDGLALVEQDNVGKDELRSSGRATGRSSSQNSDSTAATNVTSGNPWNGERSKAGLSDHLLPRMPAVTA